MVGAVSCMSLSPAAAPCLTTSALTLVASKLLPGSRPMRFIRATIDQSVTWGGFRFISSAPYLFHGRHLVDLPQRLGLGVDGGIDLLFDLARSLFPISKRCDLVAVLHLMDSIIILHSIGLSPPDDPDIWRGRVDTFNALG